MWKNAESNIQWNLGINSQEETYPSFWMFTFWFMSIVLEHFWNFTFDLINSSEIILWVKSCYTFGSETTLTIWSCLSYCLSLSICNIILYSVPPLNFLSLLFFLFFLTTSLLCFFLILSAFYTCQYRFCINKKFMNPLREKYRLLTKNIE